MLLRRLRGLLGVGLSWAVLWALVMSAIGVVIGVVDPDSIDPGEELYRVAPIVASVGFISGIAFGALLMAIEKHKSIRDLSLWRVAIWGAIGGAALPLLTGMNDQLVFNTAPLGAIASTLTVALARRGAPRKETNLVSESPGQVLPS